MNRHHTPTANGAARRRNTITTIGIAALVGLMLCAGGCAGTGPDGQWTVSDTIELGRAGHAQGSLTYTRRGGTGWETRTSIGPEEGTLDITLTLDFREEEATKPRSD